MYCKISIFYWTNIFLPAMALRPNLLYFAQTGEVNISRNITGQKFQNIHLTIQVCKAYWGYSFTASN